MDGLLQVADFLKRFSEENFLLLDVRSPKEYNQAHLPGAVNLPLLDDAARHSVGATYKQRGRQAAVIKGFELTGARFGDFIREAGKLTESGQVMVYCWRGGMRSSVMAWVLGMGGFKTWLLKGGYKSFRNHALQLIQQPRMALVVGGKTGSGKTELLKHLREAGEQVLCLETFAHHRGSAYGGIGLPPQPRNEMFENILAMELSRTVADKVLWIENESMNIGSVMLPKKIYETIRTSPMIELMMSREQRTERILNEYGGFDAEELIANTERLRRRLGGLHTNIAIDALRMGDKRLWIETVLPYYDKTYQYGTDARDKSLIVPLEVSDGEPMADIARRAIVLSHDINKNKIGS